MLPSLKIKLLENPKSRQIEISWRLCRGAESKIEDNVDEYKEKERGSQKEDIEKRKEDKRSVYEYGVGC